MKTVNVKLADIRIDGGTQPRVSLDESAIEEYAERMKAGDEFPPIRVFNDGSELWLSRGFHRYHAAKRAAWDKIEAESVQGTRRDAILDALGDNATHGVRRTNADKRKAVITLLEDDEWGKWSDREIANRCGVGNEMVSRLHREMSLCDSHSEPVTDRTYTTKHGTQAVMNTANIGKPKPIGGISPDAHRPVRQAIREAPQIALNMPRNPAAAARTLLEFFDIDFISELINELQSAIE